VKSHHAGIIPQLFSCNYIFELYMMVIIENVCSGINLDNILCTYTLYSFSDLSITILLRATWLYCNVYNIIKYIISTIPSTLITFLTDLFYSSLKLTIIIIFFDN